MSLTDRIPQPLLRALLVPGLAAGIASAQMVAANYGHLSSWKGGGFGMFSTIDATPNRYLVISGEDANGASYRILPRSSVPFLSPGSVRRIETAPSAGRLTRLAELVLEAGVAPAAADPLSLNTRARVSGLFGGLVDGEGGLAPVLEVVAESHEPHLTVRLVRVRAVVLVERFAAETVAVSVEELGPVGVAESTP